MSTRELLRVGPHTAWIEPPDIFVTRWRGEITPGQMLAITDEIEKFASSQPTILALNIVRDVTALGPETRKVISQDSRTKYLQAMAVVGASFHIRVMSTMLMKAATLIGRGGGAAIAFFDTEDEGRAWLVKKRQELAASSR